MDSLFLPSGLAALFMILGAATLVPLRTRRYSMPLLLAGALLTLVFSSGIVSTALMAPLERHYPAVHDARAHSDARHIVVLTAWASDDTTLAPSSRLNASSAYRVLAAFTLWRQRPDCDVIVSGAARTVRVMAASLRELGLPEDRLVVDEDAWNTAASATNLRGLLGTDAFFLVTSAGHMPRAMGVFDKQALHAIPVPTDFKSAPHAGSARWLPQASSLAVSDLAIHEYVGQFWYRLTDRS